MTSLSSRLRERARAALALTAFGVCMAALGPAATEAKKGEPPGLERLAKTGAGPFAAPRPSEQAPAAAQPSPDQPDRPGEAPPTKSKPAPSGNATASPAPAAPVHTDPTSAESSPQPSLPASPPAVSEPQSPAQPSAPIAERRLSTRGAAGRLEAGSGGTRRGSPAARSVEAATTAAIAAADDRFDTTNAGEGLPAEPEGDTGGGSPVTQTVEQIVEVVPESVELTLAGLLALSLVLAGASFLSGAHARRLARQRQELLQEVGLLQAALLPPVPEQLGALHTSVAYRPADGPGAGGDFYDALPLPDGRVAFILGDVSGHGRAALERTAFLRYTLRAYLEAGLEPRAALQVGGRVIDKHLHGDFATAVLAIHDPATASLTFACAGHPAPIVVGPSKYGPVLPGASPPLGIGLRTGLRQTTIPLAPGSVACLFTDGLTEARTERGILGRPRLGDILEELGRDAEAGQLLERVAAEARLVTDDMATCLFSPTGEVTAGCFRSEQLELCADELGSNVGRRFLEACAVDGEAAAGAELEAAEIAREYGGAVLNVTFGTGEPRVEIVPSNVESIEASSRRAAAAS